MCSAVMQRSTRRFLPIDRAPAAVPAIGSVQDQLVTACRAGDLVAAMAAIDGGASVNATGLLPSRTPHTPLHAAALANHRVLALYLLTLGADACDDSAMAYSVVHGDVALAQVMVDAGADVDARLLHSLTTDGRQLPRLQWVLAQPRLRLDGYAPSATLPMSAAPKPEMVAMVTAEVRPERVRGRELEMMYLSRSCKPLTAHAAMLCVWCVLVSSYPSGRQWCVQLRCQCV